MNQISIVIPTQKRLDALERTLAALAEQDLEGLDAELVVVCSGSTDRYRDQVSARVASFPLPSCVLARADGGAAGARNHGVGAAGGELILFLNDDTPPASPDLVRRHAEAYVRQPEKWRGVLGPVVWHPDVPQTPVIDWLARTGRMNDYRRIAGGDSHAQLYAPNLSIARAALVDVGGFDERFSPYGWEEYDLALRLSDRGFRVSYEPDLVAWHYHDYSLRDSLRRMEAIGRAANLLNRVHKSRQWLATPHPAGVKARIGRAIAPAATLVPLPTWAPPQFRDWALRVLHYAMVARGYSLPPIPEGAGARCGIPERRELISAG